MVELRDARSGEHLGIASDTLTFTFKEMEAHNAFSHPHSLPVVELRIASVHIVRGPAVFTSILFGFFN